MKDKILEKLKSVKYPGFEKDIVSYGFVKSVEFENEKAKITLEIVSANKDIAKQLESEIKTALKELNLREISLLIKQPEIPRETSNAASGKNIAPQIKNFVMISSGKGGVGKSTVSVNLAICLAKMGKKVGLLDLDIYGPNVPRMLGVIEAQPQVVGDKLLPVLTHGVYMMSMGVLVGAGEGLMWRGAMLIKAVMQLISDVKWGELDVMVLDMPPGTGDAQMTMAQSVPITAGVCVSTPQAVSLDDSRRALDMFNKLHIPVAGVIENMSGFLCPDNDKIYDIFGKGGAEILAKEYECEILAQIPIEMSVREGSDDGKPVSFYLPESICAKKYSQAAEKIWDFMEKINSSGGVDNSAIQPVR